MSFGRLTEEEQLAALGEMARCALPAWDLAGARVEPIKYRENAVFAVDVDGGERRVMRVHRPGYRRDEHIRSEAAWMRELARAGIPTPPVLPTRTGDDLVVVACSGVPEPRQCDLLGWVEGRPVGSLERGVDLEPEALDRTYRTVGEIAARIHAHGASWRRPPRFVRIAWDIDALVGESPTLGRFWELDCLADEPLRVLMAARDRARRRLEGLGPAASLIHGDLIPDNLLATDGRVRVIDFDDCGWSWPAFELATSIFPLVPAGHDQPALQAFLQGYRGVREFPDAELESLPDLLMARGLSYLGWPAGRPEIHSQRKLSPLFARVVAAQAERYLAR
jgi:Ser/Thr protein kinase RdoA (MazF antagonist)